MMAPSSVRDHDRAAAGLVQLDLVVELGLDQTLQVAVDGQAHVGAGCAGDDAVAAEGDGLATTVLLEEQEAWLAAQRLVQGRLEAGEALVLAAEEAQVGGAEVAFGIGTARGRREDHTRQVHLIDVLADVELEAGGEHGIGP